MNYRMYKIIYIVLFSIVQSVGASSEKDLCLSGSKPSAFITIKLSHSNPYLSRGNKSLANKIDRLRKEKKIQSTRKNASPQIAQVEFRKKSDCNIQSVDGQFSDTMQATSSSIEDGDKQLASSSQAIEDSCERRTIEEENQIFGDAIMMLMSGLEEIYRERGVNVRGCWKFKIPHEKKKKTK